MQICSQPPLSSWHQLDSVKTAELKVLDVLDVLEVLEVLCVSEDHSSSRLGVSVFLPLRLIGPTVSICSFSRLVSGDVRPCRGQF